MTTINLIRKGDYFVPSLEEDLEKLTKVKFGEIIQVTFKKPRNSKFHRKFFALLQIVVGNTDYKNVNQVLMLMKLKLGYFEFIVNTNGKLVYMPKSISFGKMDEIEFQIFYKQAIHKVLSDFLTNWEEEHVNQAIEQVIRF